MDKQNTPDNKCFTWQFRDIICDNCKRIFGGYYVESVWESMDENTFHLLHPICDKCLISSDFDSQKLRASN